LFFVITLNNCESKNEDFKMIKENFKKTIENVNILNTITYM